ncbi:hypothetical protein [Microbacterium sp. AK031]|uniref:hypothetical protein n=1 Tax=Microbacterium sp. AK031 TaxID=2723076 RepID=UPI002168BABB|nr:hypothetical protein [Microbacterium sp. AK031]MCS3842356.1 ABC-type Fe3+-siderophore transport system permease subunit [Microbacterium sp. AK031]
MTENVVSSRQPLGRWKSVIVGVAGLFYAYAVWNALAYVFTVAPVGINAYGWFILIFSVLFPILVFVVVYALGRRRTAGELTIAMIAGLALVAVFWMNVAALSMLTTSFLSP